MIVHLCHLIGLVTVLPGATSAQVALPTLKGSFTLEYEAVKTENRSQELIEDSLLRLRDDCIEAQARDASLTDERIDQILKSQRQRLEERLASEGKRSSYAYRVLISSDGKALLVGFYGPKNERKTGSQQPDRVALIYDNGMVSGPLDVGGHAGPVACNGLQGLPHVGVTFPLLPFQSGGEFLLTGPYDAAKLVYRSGVLRSAPEMGNKNPTRLSFARNEAIYIDIAFDDYRSLNGVMVAGHIIERTYSRRKGSKLDGAIAESVDFRLKKITNTALPKSAYLPATYFASIR